MSQSDGSWPVWINGPSEIEKLMNSQARQAIALFGGAAVFVLAFGFGGGSGNLASNTPTTTLASSSAPSAPTADSDAPNDTGCIPGANC